MALTTLANVRMVPGFGNVVKYTDAWLNTLISAADETIKRWCKQNLELRAYTTFMSGNEQPDLVLPQFPAWSGITQIAAGSNGAVLPQATINVVSTLANDGVTNAFDPGGRSDGDPTLTVQTGVNSWTTVTYTGKTATSFTGCSGGTGTLSSTTGLNGVSQPSVWIDFTGNWGQRQPYNSSDAGPFSAGTIQVNGANFAVNLNRHEDKSRSGLLTRIGGYGAGGWMGAWPSWGGQIGGIGKLSTYRLPCWPRGYGNIKVCYSAGYEDIPSDLQFAATSLVSQMARWQPVGGPLQSESLGAYSYSLLVGSGNDMMVGEIRRILSRYQEMSW